VLCVANSCINHSFYIYICSFNAFLLHCTYTWYGVRGQHNFWGGPVAQQPLPSLVLKLLLQLTIVQTVRTTCTTIQAVITAFTVVQAVVSICPVHYSVKFHASIFIQSGATDIFFISHNLKIQDGGSRHLVFWGCEFNHTGVLTVWNLRFVPNLVQISVIVTEIDVLMFKTFIWWRHGN